MTVRDIVLGVDLDQVVFQYIEAIHEELKKAGLRDFYEEPEFYDFSKSGWFDSNDDFKKFHGDLVEDGLYEKLKLLPDAHSVLWDLSDSGYEINIITSRFVNPGQHKKVIAQTGESLDANGIPYSNLAFLDNKVNQYADAYIDDSPYNVESLVGAGRRVYRQVMRYNADCPGIPVRSWKETRELLRQEFGK